MRTAISRNAHKKIKEGRNDSFFLDNLRVSLTCLVVVYHVAVIYRGGIPLGYYTEQTQDPATSVMLNLVVIISETFFMGLFFFLAGYFTPGSYDRKGAGAFLKDRLLRLGIPLLVFDLLIDPLIRYVADGLPQPFSRFLSEYLLTFQSIPRGPLWFVEVLFLFGLCYIVWRKLSGRRWSGAQPRPFPSLPVVALFVLALAIATFLTRIHLTFFWSGAANFWFPLFRFGWAAQYIGMFIVGIMTSRYNWLFTLPEKAGKISLWSLMGSVAFLLLIFVVGFDGGKVFEYYVLGGWHWQTFALALWECNFGVAISVGLLVLFRKKLNGQGKVARWLAGNAYTVYILHMLVIVCLAYALRGFGIYPLLKFLLVGMMALPLCFGMSHLIRQLPLARKIL